MTSDDSPVRLLAGALAVLMFAELVTLPAVAIWTLALAAASRLTRCRPLWLVVPASVAGCWLLAWPASVRQLAGEARQTAVAAIAAAARPSLVSHLAVLTMRQLRPPELAAAMLLATAQAGVLVTPPPLTAALRSRRSAAGAGRSAGTVPAGRALARWGDAEGGVLVAGSAAAATAIASAIACAALRRRKAILVLDLAAASTTTDRATPSGGVAASGLAANVLVAAAGRPAGSRVLTGQGVADSLPRLFGLAIRHRGVAVVTAPGPSAGPAVATLTALFTSLRGSGLRADALVCVAAGEPADPAGLARLLEAGRDTGTAVLVLTSTAGVDRQLRAAARWVITPGADGRRLVEPGPRPQAAAR